jgi:hypothetical protein
LLEENQVKQGRVNKMSAAVKKKSGKRKKSKEKLNNGHCLNV